MTYWLFSETKFVFYLASPSDGQVSGAHLALLYARSPPHSASLRKQCAPCWQTA